MWVTEVKPTENALTFEGVSFLFLRPCYMEHRQGDDDKWIEKAWF
jgi:hypothetical protein